MTRNLTLLCMAPARMRIAGRTYEATAAEQASARDIAERIAGLVDVATDGQVRIETHWADPQAVYDTTGSGRPQPYDGVPIVRMGTGTPYASQFGFDAYELRVFMGAASLMDRIGRGSGGRYWSFGGGERWVWVGLGAGEDYVDKVHTGLGGEVLLHELLHQVQDRLAAATPTIDIVNIDDAGSYGYREHPTRGWFDFLAPNWAGEFVSKSSRKGDPGLTAERARLMPSRSPVTPAAGVTILPFRRVVPGEPWTSSSRKPAPVVTTPTSPTRPTRRPRGT